MCFGLETLAIISAIGGAGVSAYGSYQQGQAQKQAANYQAEISSRNAQIATRNAADARARGLRAQQDKALETRAMLGNQRAIFADRNVDIASGSPIEVLGNTAAFGKLDALTIRDNFEREAIGYETQSGNFSADAASQRMAGRAAGVSGTLGAIGAGIGAVSQITEFRSNRRLAVS